MFLQGQTVANEHQTLWQGQTVVYEHQIPHWSQIVNFEEKKYATSNWNCCLCTSNAKSNCC